MAGSGEVIVNYLPANTSPTTDDKVMVVRNADGELTNVTLADIKTLITQGSSGIFWVTYNVTTYSQIKAADLAGKLPVIRMNVVSSNSYTTSEFYLSRLTNSSAVFAADQPSAPGIRPMVIVCDSNNVWSMDYSKYDSDYVAYDSSKSYSAGTVGLKLTELGGAVPSPYSSNPADVGAAFVGSSNTFARGDHAHDLSSDLKAAILQLASKVAYIDDQGQTYYQDLYDALYPGVTYAVTNTLTGCTTSNSAVAVPQNSSYSATISPSSGYSLTGATVSVTMGGVNITATAYNAGTITIASVTGNIAISVAAVAVTLSSISAVYTQSGTVYTDDSLDSLKSDLVVTATWSDTSTTTVPSADYTLSGTLAEGTQTITVLYGGDTATFTVACTVRGWLYHFNQSLVSSGSEDFNLTGNAVYATGRLGTDYAYSHIIPTSGDATTDTQLGLKALSLSREPNFGGDFTFSFWLASQINFYFHPFSQAIYLNGNYSSGYFSSATAHVSGWSASLGNSSNKFVGFLIQAIVNTHSFNIRFNNGSKGANLEVSMPQSIDTTQWHHYAITRKGNDVMVFFDGVKVATAVAQYNTVYSANQVSISTFFGQTEATKNDLSTTGNGEKIQDLYISEFCKWDSSFDIATITY